MPTFVGRSTIAPHFRKAHFKALEKNGKLPDDIARYVAAHREYLDDLKAKGKIICGGPMVDFTWGLTVLKADSLDEAKTLLENDPAMIHGLFSDCEAIPWYRMQ